MQIKRILLFFLFILILGSIIGVLKYAHYTPTLRIGVNAYSGGEFLQLARKALFFDRAGIHVKIVEFGSLGDVQQAFEWHQINGMVCPLVDALVVRQELNYDDPKIILIPSYLKREYACQVLVNDSIKTIKDLKGKSIGVEMNSYGHYVLAKALKTEGLTLQDVTIIPMDPTAAPAFFRHQRVDCVVAYPPFIDPIKSFTHCIYDSSDWTKEMQLNVLIMNKKTINDYRKQLIKFVKSWDALLDYHKKKPSSSQKILSIHHSVSVEEAEKLFQVVYPLYVEEQRSFFRSNRLLLDILLDINLIILQNDNLDPLKNPKALDSIFDPFFIKETLK